MRSDVIETIESEPIAEAVPPRPSDGLPRAFLRPCGTPYFVRKAAAFLSLNEAERNELESRVGRSTTVPADTVLYRRGDPVRRVLIVVSGVLVESATGPDGGTQNFRFYFPGDSIGGHEIASHHHSADLRTLTSVSYAAVPAASIPPRVNGRLSALFFALRMVEQTIVSDRMRTIGRGRAEERLLHLMLELNARQRLTEPSIGDRVWCPFSQVEIGDAIGLTNVYVSRTMNRLRGEGMLRSDGRTVTILDRSAAIRRTSFVDRYADIDLSRMGAGDLTIR